LSIVGFLRMVRVASPTLRVTLAGLLLLALLGRPLVVRAGPTAELEAQAAGSRDEADIRHLIDDYAHAIETRDIAQFRKVKPNLGKEEEARLRKAFESIQSQVVKVTILSLEVQGTQATARLARRDTINGSLVSSFPQTLTLVRNQEAWTIEQIR
jgi:hypothetical protein